jgi:hypothetical protein
MTQHALAALAAVTQPAVGGWQRHGPISEHGEPALRDLRRAPRLASIWRRQEILAGKREAERPCAGSSRFKSRAALGTRRVHYAARKSRGCADRAGDESTQLTNRSASASAPAVNQKPNMTELPMKTLIACRACAREISPDATSCPNCGDPRNEIQPKPKQTATGLLAAILIGLIVGLALYFMI